MKVRTEPVKSLLFLWLIFVGAFQSTAQQTDCNLKPPVYTIHFGTGNVRDINRESLSNYYRVETSCPADGHYSFASSTANCFNDDWHTLSEDHTPGDVNGNMMLVNASYNPGIFLRTPINGLKGNTRYEFGVWLMNLCKPSDKCPYPLLPNLSIRLESPDGRSVGSFNTGDLPRLPAPHWTQHRAMFLTPAGITSVTLTMADNAPGGCGNDFAMDDITIRECVEIPLTAPAAGKMPPPKLIAEKKEAVSTRPVPKKINAQTAQKPKEKEIKSIRIARPVNDSAAQPVAVLKQVRNTFPPPPQVIRTRSNLLAKRIELDPGEIRIDVYDNGEIDGDTVTIYHNNSLIIAHAGLTDKPITFRITIDPAQPHHELVMVADNLGSIPPNTSVMIITAGDKRYEVFISSTEQQNAKVILDLKR